MAMATVAAQDDAIVALRLNEVLALVRRPEWLVSPGFVLRVVIRGRKRPNRPRFDPASL